MPKRRQVERVVFPQYILGEMASVLVVNRPRRPYVVRRAARIARELCLVEVTDSDCQSVIESFRLMTAAIGGDTGNKRLTSKERGDFYHARHLLTRQLRGITLKELREGAEKPAEPPLVLLQQVAASG